MLDGRLIRGFPMGGWATGLRVCNILLLQRTLLNLPRDMTLDSSLAASFFSATFRIFDSRDILPCLQQRKRARFPRKFEL